MSELIVVFLFGISVASPFAGLCVLLSWLIWGDRAGTHIHLVIYGLPLYSAEAFLLGSGIHFLMARYISPESESLRLKDLSLSPSWLGFYTSGVLSALRGLAVYPTVSVLRDSAIIYYSIFCHLTSFLLGTEQRLRTLVYLLAAVVSAKSLFAFLDIHMELDLTSFQPAAISLYMGCFLIVSLFTAPLWLNRRTGWWLLMYTFVTVLFMEYLVRSSWMGLLIAFLFYAYSMRSYKLTLRQMHTWPMGVMFVLGVVLSFYTPRLRFEWPTMSSQSTVSKKEHSIPQIPDESRPEAVAIAETFGRPKPTPPPPPPPLPPSVPPPLLQPQPVSSRMTPPSIQKAAVSPAKSPRRSVSPVLSELKTFASGLQSPNVLTRFIFWTEITEEVFSVELPLFRAFLRNPYRMTPQYREALESLLGKFMLDDEIPSPRKKLLSTSPALRLVNGVPMGKPFIPKRIFWWLRETTRYDPHNSHLAILYRTGVVGFLCYSLILFLSLRRSHLYLQEAPHPKATLSMLATMACFLFYVVHALTDVTLENPYKGIPFWVLLGLLTAIPRIYPTATRGSIP